MATTRSGVPHPSVTLAHSRQICQQVLNNEPKICPLDVLSRIVNEARCAMVQSQGFLANLSLLCMEPRLATPRVHNYPIHSKSQKDMRLPRRVRSP